MYIKQLTNTEVALCMHVYLPEESQTVEFVSPLQTVTALDCERQCPSRLD